MRRLDYNYDDYEDFHSYMEDEGWDYIDEDEAYEDDENEDVDSYDDSMDGDIESGLASAGWGTDEDYGYYGEDNYYGEDF